jgi:sec-independent protein translocase protein TatB
MFDIGFPELILVCVVALLVLGPERLPVALRTLGLWVGRARRSFLSVKAEIEREIGMDEVRRQLHNETVLEDLRKLERDVKGKPTSSIAPHNAGPEAAPEAVAALPEQVDVATNDTPEAVTPDSHGAPAEKQNHG